MTAEHDAWLARRKAGIGSSQSPALLGVSPWAGPLDVFLQATGMREPTEPTSDMKRGLRMEEPIAAEYAEHEDCPVFRVGLKHQPRIHPRASHVLASIDRLRLNTPGGVYIGNAVGFEYESGFDGYLRDHVDRIVELKYTGWRQAHLWGEPGTDNAPQHVLVQVQQQMEVWDLPRADVAVLIGGDDFRVYHVERDREVGAMIVEAIEKFWKAHVETGIPPALDASPAAAEYLRLKWPHAEEKTINVEQVSPLASLVREYRAAVRAAEITETEKERVTNLIKAEMGEAAALQFDGGKITWRDIASTRVDLKALRQELGAGIVKFERTTTARRFMAKFDKEETDGK
jgi:putative phage-type endonuclease